MTGYILRVEIESPQGTAMEDLQFALDFYVERERVQHLEKGDLLRVRKGAGYEYYVNIDSNFFQRGHLICKATIVDPEAMWETRKRPIVVTGYTGITIGLCNYQRRNKVECMDYVMEFQQVEDVPKNDGLRIFYGVTKRELTPEVANGFAQLPLGEYANIAIDVKEGDRLYVLVPYEEDYEVLKNNGLGGLTTFDTSIDGANGEKELTIDGARYKIYGEFQTLNGIIRVTVS